MPLRRGSAQSRDLDQGARKFKYSLADELTIDELLEDTCKFGLKEYGIVKVGGHDSRAFSLLFAYGDLTQGDTGSDRKYTRANDWQARASGDKIHHPLMQDCLRVTEEYQETILRLLRKGGTGFTARALEEKICPKFRPGCPLSPYEQLQRSIEVRMETVPIAEDSSSNKDDL